LRVKLFGHSIEDVLRPTWVISSLSLYSIDLVLNVNLSRISECFEFTLYASDSGAAEEGIDSSEQMFLSLEDILQLMSSR